MIVSRHLHSTIAWTVPVFLMTVFAVGCSPELDESPSTAAPAAAPAAPPPAAPTTHAVSGKGPGAINGVPAVVLLAPQTPHEYPLPAERPFMDQITMTFTPALLFVRTGQPTEFRNSDDVLHNVRVRDESTKEGVFNVAIPTGATYSHAFPRDGFYDVGCDIHPGMTAQILATSTPYATVADADGNFTFENVEPGEYLVTIYSGTQKIEGKVDVAGPRTEVAF
jgi:plastocyanin